MAKDLYCGIDGKARKIKAIYVGVNGVARKVKAGYLGVGNVARPFFSSAFKVTINAPANAKIVVTPEASVITSIPAFEVAKGTTKVIDYPAGKTIKLECVPDEGYAFSEWNIQPPPIIAKPTFEFTIDNKIDNTVETYTAEERMSWEQWLNSEYNTGTYVLSGYAIMNKEKDIEYNNSIGGQGRIRSINYNEVMIDEKDQIHNQNRKYQYSLCFKAGGVN